MLNLTSRKRSRAALVTALTLAVPALFALALPARADTRSDFEKGCKDSKGTFTENAENITCSGTGRTTITCNKTATSCTASAQPGRAKPGLPTAGAFRSNATGPTTAPPVHRPPTVRRLIFHAPAMLGRRKAG